MLKFTTIDGKDCGDIKLFELSTCAWCNKTKRYLNNNNIAYSYIDVDLLSQEDQKECILVQSKYDDSESYPLITIGKSDCIVGYDKEELDKLIGV